jgi:hypothetical protein
MREGGTKVADVSIQEQPHADLQRPGEEDRPMSSIFWRRFLVPLMLYVITMEMLGTHFVAERLSNGLHFQLQLKVDVKDGKEQELPAKSLVHPIELDAHDGIGKLINRYAPGKGGGKAQNLPVSRR